MLGRHPPDRRLGTKKRSDHIDREQVGKPGTGHRIDPRYTIDDARASKAAGVPFIGIAARANPRYDELVSLLHGEGAAAILDDINSLETVIAQNS